MGISEYLRALPGGSKVALLTVDRAEDLLSDNTFRYFSRLRGAGLRGLRHLHQTGRLLCVGIWVRVMVSVFVLSGFVEKPLMGMRFQIWIVESRHRGVWMIFC